MVTTITMCKCISKWIWQMPDAEVCFFLSSGPKATAYFSVSLSLGSYTLCDFMLYQTKCPKLCSMEGIVTVCHWSTWHKTFAVADGLNTLKMLCMYIDLCCSPFFSRCCRTLLIHQLVYVRPKFIRFREQNNIRRMDEHTLAFQTLNFKSAGWVIQKQTGSCLNVGSLWQDLKVDAFLFSLWTWLAHVLLHFRYSDIHYISGFPG